MAAEERVRERSRREVDEANPRFARDRADQALRRSSTRDLTQADGELTPTLKVKRGVVYEQLRATCFEALYEEPRS